MSIYIHIIIVVALWCFFEMVGNGDFSETSLPTKWAPVVSRVPQLHL